MSHFIKQGNTFKVVSEEALDLHKALPPGNFTIGQDISGQLFLEKIEPFSLPSKLYGDTLRHTDRILNTFMDRPNNTGVLLAGEKGSGKTLLAKSIAMEGARRSIPTVVINRPWKGDAFNGLIQAINQPTIVLFDEFEKVYESDDQDHILTLMDGVYTGNKLFLLTCNDKWRINKHMQNRPGRIFYYLEFSSIGEQFIREYCEDNLENKQYIDVIANMALAFSSFNFDMLKALVEDMNRYDEGPHEVLELLNARPEYSERIHYDVEFYQGNINIESNKIYNMDHDGLAVNPFNGVSIHYEDPKENSDGYIEDLVVNFTPEHLVKVDAQTGTFVFESGVHKLMLRKKQTSKPDYWKAF